MYYVLQRVFYRTTPEISLKKAITLRTFAAMPAQRAFRACVERSLAKLTIGFCTGNACYNFRLSQFISKKMQLRFKDEVRVFYNRATGAMFTGDLYIQTKTKVVLDEENIVHTLASLKKLLHFDFEQVYCCHAGFLADGRAKISEKIAYLEDLEGEVRKLYSQGYTDDAITKAIFRREYPITKVSGEQWSSKHIITAFTKQFKQES
ncbi:hypothetical protein LSPH24S_08160 [Lysinibacillus sphaericus]